ncbi:unnamed protein product [Staurois parvus]|uniref:Uncharacterized protein n=1 Tax=Staurois parvus TaxID=386267 RepID=A0ABN9HBB9_9NEOB|nr:unnamed protein product [Staurois parvus]
MTAGTGSDIGSSEKLEMERASGHQASAGTGSPGIRSFGLPACTASSGKAVGTGSPGIGSSGSTAGHRVTRYDSGHWVTRHQVIWLASGHRVIWQGSGHRVTRYDSGL